MIYVPYVWFSNAFLSSWLSGILTKVYLSSIRSYKTPTNNIQECILHWPWLDNIRMDLQLVGCWFMDWIGLAQDRHRWRTLVSAVMNLRVP